MNIRREIVCILLASGVLIAGALSAVYVLGFKHQILGFFRIGTVLPLSPYLYVPDSAAYHGELGYDGQLYLSIALDPLLANPGTIRALDNPPYRYRRILFPALANLAALSHRPAIPYVMVGLNALCFAGIVFGIALFCEHERRIVWWSLLALGALGAWISLLFTTADLAASVLLVFAVYAHAARRGGIAAILVGSACLAHDTMLVGFGAFVFDALLSRDRKAAIRLLVAALPFVAWNVFVKLWMPAPADAGSVFDNLALPGLGLARKLREIGAGPLSAKWLFDSSTFVVLSGQLALLVFAALREPRLRLIGLCALGYLALFAMADRDFLNYYINTNRVFMNVAVLLAMSLAGKQFFWPKVAMLSASACSSALFVAAFCLGRI